MSRHSFFGKMRNGKEVEVCSGWDPPLCGFHLTIWEKNDDENIVYDNVCAPEWFPNTTERFEKILDSLGIIVPDGFWKTVQTKL